MRRSLLACLILVNVARPALAQTAVFGVVDDQTGSPLAGVLVELDGPARGPRGTVTDDTGRRARWSKPAR